MNQKTDYQPSDKVHHMYYPTHIHSSLSMQSTILLWQVRLSVCLPVCPSHSGIVPKVMYILSNSFHHLVGAWLLALMPLQNSKGILSGGVKHTNLLLMHKSQEWHITNKVHKTTKLNQLLTRASFSIITRHDMILYGFCLSTWSKHCLYTANIPSLWDWLRSCHNTNLIYSNFNQHEQPTINIARISHHKNMNKTDGNKLHTCFKFVNYTHQQSIIHHAVVGHK